MPSQRFIESDRPRLWSTYVTLLVISVVAVGLRMWSRRISGAGFWWDDGMALVALLFATTFVCLEFATTKEGMGLHVQDLPGGPAHLPVVMRLSYAAEVLIHPCLATVKYTVLLFFARIFTAPAFRKMLWVVGAFVTLWLVGTDPVLVFECTPVKKAWLGDTVPGRCVNIRAFFIAQAVLSTLLDVVLLCLPIVFIFRLQMSLSQKLALLLVFSIGIFETVCSIVRLVVFIRLVNQPNEADLSWNYTPPSIWSVIEVEVGLICASLMACGPLIKGLSSRLRSSTTGSSATATRMWSRRAHGRNSANGAKPFVKVSMRTPRDRTPAWRDQRFTEDKTALGRPENGSSSLARESFEQLIAATRSGKANAAGSAGSGDPVDDLNALRLDEIKVTRDVRVTQTPSGI